MKAEEEARRRAQVEAQLKEEEDRLKAEQEARIKAEEESLRVAEELRQKAEEEMRLRREQAEARLKEAEARLRADEEAAAKAEQETLRVAEEIRLRAEEEARRREEAEARLKEEEERLREEQEARARAEEEAQRRAEEVRAQAEEAHAQAEEARAQAEAVNQLRLEAEQRVREEEARLLAEQEARLRAEAEAERLVQEKRARTAEEAQMRAEAEARVQAEQARLQAEQARLQEEQQAHLHAVKESTDEEAESFSGEQFAFVQSVKPSDTQPQDTNETTYHVEAVEIDEPEVSWVDVQVHEAVVLPVADDAPVVAPEQVSESSDEPAKAIDVLMAEKGIASAEDESGIPSEILNRLISLESAEREAALSELVAIGGDDAFRHITRAFDDPTPDVRNAAARALFDLQTDRAASFTRALREGTPERRRKIGHAMAESGLAAGAVGNLTGESREKTYDAFSFLFLMAKAGEVKPLLSAIEEYPNVEVRIAVVKLLALSGQSEIVPAFRRLAVRGSLPSEVRSAVMEAIYQISSQARESASSAA